MIRFALINQSQGPVTSLYTRRACDTHTRFGYERVFNVHIYVAAQRFGHRFVTPRALACACCTVYIREQHISKT